MKTRIISLPSLVAAGVFVACSPPSPPPGPSSGETIYLRLEDFELVSTDVLIGQDAIDAQRARMERDLQATLAVDPDHPGVEQIRKALANLDWRERQLHWRISRGFTRPDGTYGGPRTEEEFWRAFIEDWEMLELTEGQVRAAEAVLDSILASQDSLSTDTTSAASAGGTVDCTSDLFAATQCGLNSTTPRHA